MYSEEETELRDLIIQSLEGCGFLNKIKAELRAGVFLALEEDGSLKNKIPLINQKLDDFKTTLEGKLLLSLIREFLQHFNLSFTLSVFDPEVSLSSYMTRSELFDELKVKSEFDEPVISSLLKEEIENMKFNSYSKSNNKFNSGVDKSVNSLLTETATSNANDYSDARDNEQILNLKNLESNNNATKDKLHDSTKPTSNALSEVHADDQINSNSEINVSNINTKNRDDDTNKTIFKESKIYSEDHDPFFDEPLPSEKTSFFGFSDSLKEKPESKINSIIKHDSNEFKKNSLSSLRDLPSLTSNTDWTFTRDGKSTLPSLDSVKSVSNLEVSNNELSNLNVIGSSQKKDFDNPESNESSEKQNSESIEEEIEEDFSAGFDDLLNSSLSLADDATTDQTVSQVSIVEGIDHVEPCNN